METETFEALCTCARESLGCSDPPGQFFGNLFWFGNCAEKPEMGPLFLPADLLALLLIQERCRMRKVRLSCPPQAILAGSFSGQSVGYSWVGISGCREAHEVSPCHTGVELESDTAVSVSAPEQDADPINAASKGSL